MHKMKSLLQDVMKNGHMRNTRSGDVVSVFNRSLEFDLSEGFPAVTSKKLAWRAVVGELLWFLSGSTNLTDLRKYTFGADENQWTIWSDDVSRWHRGSTISEFVGTLYPYQFRSATGVTGVPVDQISNLIHGLKTDPHGRRHIVMAWSPPDVEQYSAPLPPCHIGFQCYVDAEDKLNLHWFQRSWDLFLGSPFNIASYALLLHLLAEWTGLGVGKLSVWAGDIHIYMTHMESVYDYIKNEEYDLPSLVLPEGTESLSSTLKLTALDFENSLVGYKNAGIIKAPLSVGA